MKGITYNFVINASDAATRAYAEGTGIDTASVMARGDLSWCLEAYRYLSQRRNLRVSLSNRLNSHAVNIVHAAQLLEMKGSASHFIVCVQADHQRRHWAHYHLVQNESQLLANTAFVPHWIQPNLIPRRPERNKVTQVTYVGPTGVEANIWEEELQTFLKPHAIVLEPVSGPWNDLSAADVLVGIRSFDDNPHPNKPASRLFSAWHARVAFIGGPDSAYRQVGTPGEDYLVARSPKQVAAAVLQLHADDGLYKKLVENGSRKTERYNNNAIAQSWESILAGPVLKRYQHWKARPHYEQVRFNSLLNLGLL